MHMSDIIINIKGVQAHAGGQEKTEITTAGSLVLRGDKDTISYGAMDGEEGLPEYTELIVDEKTVTMKKFGPEEAEFVFEHGKVYYAMHDTPFGSIEMIVYPTLVDVKLSDYIGKIELEYVLDIAGVQTVNRLCVSYAQELAER